MAKKKKTRRPHQGARLEKSLPGLGYSPARETAAGAGTHGGGPRAENRRERRQSRQALRGW
jgi:hypothetical protein